MLSYAQNFEDVILWRALKHVKAGRYLDVGAQDPVVDSVSLMFYEQGWRGVHVEPSAHYAEKLRAARPDEEVLEAAIGSRPGTIHFYEIPGTGLSTASKAVASRHGRHGWTVRETLVECVTLKDALARFAGADVHWMKIDVEGCEKQVLEGWRDSPVRPWIVVVESTVPLLPTSSHRKWERLILSMGYRFAYFDGLNRFYLSRRHSGLARSFGPGPNVFDGFALSGLASATFCTAVNARAKDLEQRLHAEADAHRGELMAREERHVAEKLRHEQRADGLDAQLRDMARRADALDAKLRDALARDEARTGELDALARRANDLDAALQSSLAREAALASQFRTRGEYLASRHAELALIMDQAVAVARALEGKFQLVSNENSARKAEIDRITRMLADCEMRLERVVGSLSWRLTMPARRLRELAKRVWKSAKFSLNPEIETLLDTLMSAEPAGTSASMTEADHVVDYLVFDDAAFIDAAYTGLLRRAPDPDGGAHYLERLQEGASKLAILRDIRRSPEGRAAGIPVRGLALSAGLESAYRWPLVGGLLRVAARPFAYSSTSKYCKLTSLLACHDEDFVQQVYRRILLRAPDTGGHDHYLELLRRGAEKVEIIGRIRYSAEGNRVGVVVHGLLLPWAIRCVYSVPVLGSLCRILGTLLRAPGLERRQRVLENQLRRIEMKRHEDVQRSTSPASEQVDSAAEMAALAELSHRALSVLQDLRRAIKRG